MLFKTLGSALESYKFQFNSMTPCSSFLATQARFPWKLWPSWRHEVNVVSSVTWHLQSRRVRSEICCQILSSTRRIYLRLPLLTLLDMWPGMYSSREVLRLDLPRHLERLGVGTSLCLRHPGDALNLRLLLLRCRSLNPSYPISTLPEHLHSTFPSYAKLPENTLTEKKNIPFPSLTLITCLTGPPVTPTPFTGRPSHTLSYTTILFLALKVNGRFLESLPVVTFASLELKLPVFSFH